MGAIKKDDLSIFGSKKYSHWNSAFVHEHFLDHYNNLTNKELDSEFKKELCVLAKSLCKLDKTERKAMVDVLANVIAFYLENKVNKEIEDSFSRIFKFV
ncbi:MAG: hypothetical protein ACPG7E_02870 [Marinirhabdus sp.]